jgi:hypothetical protein
MIGKRDKIRINRKIGGGKKGVIYDKKIGIICLG